MSITRHRLFLVGLLFFLLALGLLLFLNLKHRFPASVGPSPSPASINLRPRAILTSALDRQIFGADNSQPIGLLQNLPETKVGLADPARLQTYLTTQGLLGSKIKQVAIIISASVPDPDHVMYDDQDRHLLQAQVSQVGQVAIIEIGVGEYVQSQTVTDKARWLENIVWRAIRYLAAKNSLPTDGLEAGQTPVFVNL